MGLGDQFVRSKLAEQSVSPRMAPERQGRAETPANGRLAHSELGSVHTAVSGMVRKDRRYLLGVPAAEGEHLMHPQPRRDEHGGTL